VKNVTHLLMAGVLSTVVVAGCDGFLDVTNPNVVQADAIDPDADGPMMAWSAFQDFVSGYGDLLVNTGWFTTEIWTGDSSDLRSEIGRRSIDPSNSRLLNDVWVRFSRGLATSENAIDILKDAENASSNVHLARVSLSAGYSYLLMAETFCQGTARGGPPLSESRMLDLAVERLEQARSVGAAAGGAQGTPIAVAAAVGLGRAHLLAGRSALAASAVGTVPSDFEFLLYTADDPANRERLGNRFWQETIDRESVVTPAAYVSRANEGETRIAYRDLGITARDGFLHFNAQNKYTRWNTPYRLASGLEARYIAIEAAGGEAPMLAFINTRREAAQRDAVSGLTGNELLSEFLAQKSIDFWLEGTRMGDFRRHGMLVPWVLPPGAEFYKPAAGPVGTQTCFPLPFAETSTNPNF
jgi:hypothetical protein